MSTTRAAAAPFCIFLNARLSFLIHNLSFLIHNSSLVLNANLADVNLCRGLFCCKIHHFKYKIHHFEYTIQQCFLQSCFTARLCDATNGDLLAPENQHVFKKPTLFQGKGLEFYRQNLDFYHFPSSESSFFFIFCIKMHPCGEWLGVCEGVQGSLALSKFIIFSTEVVEIHHFQHRSCRNSSFSAQKFIMF